MKTKLLITTNTELSEILRQIIREEDTAKQNTKTFSIHQAAKLLGRSHVTIKRYIDRDLIKATSDNRILESEIHKLLTSPKKT